MNVIEFFKEMYEQAKIEAELEVKEPTFLYKRLENIYKLKQEVVTFLPKIIDMEDNFILYKSQQGNVIVEISEIVGTYRDLSRCLLGYELSFYKTKDEELRIRPTFDPIGLKKYYSCLNDTEEIFNIKARKHETEITPLLGVDLKAEDIDLALYELEQILAPIEEMKEKHKQEVRKLEYPLDK